MPACSARKSLWHAGARCRINRNPIWVCGVVSCCPLGSGHLIARTEEPVSTENLEKWLARPLRIISVAEVSELAASVGTTVGDVRSENQDRAVIARFTSTGRPRESFVCFALCDGMGGMADGARCAQIALSSFLFRLTHDPKQTASEMVRASALAANAEVYRQYRERGGTTLVAIVVFQESAAAVSIGDSRIYVADDRKELKQISIDDTIAGELNQLKGLRPSRAGWDTIADQLAQFVGIGEGIEPRVYPISTNLAYLLTSDGVHNMSPDTLKQIFSSGRTPQLVVSRLLQVSRWCGGSDNATAICVPPLRSDWSASPVWGSGDWLEVWDAVGKLELPIHRSAAPSTRESEMPKRTESADINTKRPKRRISGAIKKKAVSASTDFRPAVRQGSLKIEIVDEKPQDAAAGDIEPSDLAPKKSTDDQGAKRE
jgi:serine/threonine protein phosphatase PrpC